MLRRRQDWHMQGDVEGAEHVCLLQELLRRRRADDEEPPPTLRRLLLQQTEDHREDRLGEARADRDVVEEPLQVVENHYGERTLIGVLEELRDRGHLRLLRVADKRLTANPPDEWIIRTRRQVR